MLADSKERDAPRRSPRSAQDAVSFDLDHHDHGHRVDHRALDRVAKAGLDLTSTGSPSARRNAMGSP